MTDTENNQENEPTTSPSDPTHEATTPPGNPEQDADDTSRSEEKLDQAGGGH